VKVVEPGSSRTGRIRPADASPTSKPPPQMANRNLGEHHTKEHLPRPQAQRRRRIFHGRVQPAQCAAPVIQKRKVRQHGDQDTRTQPVKLGHQAEPTRNCAQTRAPPRAPPPATPTSGPQADRCVPSARPGPTASSTQTGMVHTTSKAVLTNNSPTQGAKHQRPNRIPTRLHAHPKNETQRKQRHQSDQHRGQGDPRPRPAGRNTHGRHGEA